MFKDDRALALQIAAFFCLLMVLAGSGIVYFFSPPDNPIGPPAHVVPLPEAVVSDR